MAKLPDKAYRLRSPTRIGELFDSGARVHDSRATLVGLSSDQPVPRLALAVSRKHGGAVRRNRVRRLGREAFRLVRNDLPGGWDLVLIPRVRDDHTAPALAESLRNLFRRLERTAAHEAGPT